MKYFRFYSILLLCILSCSNKTATIDSLITRISNQQIEMSHQFISLPQIKSPSADSLIQIGKPATEKLIAVLDDTSKGIVAHFILSSIWYNEQKKDNQLDSLEPRDSRDEGKGTVNIIDGLKYYNNEELGSYAEKEELERNKNKWQKFIDTINLRQSIHD